MGRRVKPQMVRLVRDRVKGMKMCCEGTMSVRDRNHWLYIESTSEIGDRFYTSR